MALVCLSQGNLMTVLKNLMSMKGRTALITGAAGRMGQVMSDTLAEMGANLILVDKQTLGLEDLKRKISARWSVGVEIWVCDLEIQVQRAELVEYLKKCGSDLNVLINNAAFIGSSDLDGWSVSFENQTIDTWRRALEVNLTAIFDVCHGLVPILRHSEGASIINIASIYGLHGPDWSLYEGTGMSNPAAYSASKGGVIQFTRWLATTIAPNIRVNSISPGGVYRNQPSEFVRRYEGKTPLGRMAVEDDFRGGIAYLASDMSRYVTGHNLVIDGGWGAW